NASRHCAHEYKEIPSQRRVIPATLQEKLSYYRSFVSSPSKTQIISVQQIEFNRFQWYYIFNVFCKSLPTTYVYVFLSCYAPEEHFFISKMTPIFYGCMWSSILSGFIETVIYSYYVTLLWDYTICGLLYKNPWNRCDEKVHMINNYTITCYNVIEFSEKIKNESIVFERYGYKIVAGADEILQIAPTLFFKTRMQSVSFTRPAMFLILWVTVGLLHKQLFKKAIWKCLNYTQWALNFIFVITFAHLVIYYFKVGFVNLHLQVPEYTREIWQTDIDMLAESMTGPPIVHILTARGTEKVKPSRHSSIIIASNAAYYIFRGLLIYMMNRYCETLTGAPVQLTQLHPYSSFYLWPTYLSYFYLGDFYSILFFLLNSITEFFVVMITFNCLVEAIVSEWVWLKRWIAISLLCVIGNIYNYTINEGSTNVLYIFCTGAATLWEVIALYCFYPLGRLIDDITFHCGVPPTSLRIFNLRLVPIFYTLKYIAMMNNVLKILHFEHYERYNPHYMDVLYCVSIGPFLLGAVYAVFYVVFRKKEKWTQLLVPRPEWGPKDFNIRQLRKLYDSREYIGSQASRQLSRYFMEKSELETYKLDIMYEGLSRHSTLQSEVRFEQEKKSN
ncbi:uncharacterized protein, partial [Epargyreus clarus]|uniref:uncharacterized protein n=1 Tax=Epargyreus clarus TaxID=520877 RepID=UPI003C2F51D5